MARKKTRKKTARKTRKTRKTARKTARRRKSREPKVAAHGKTAAERRRYIEYLRARRRLIREYFR